MEKSINTRPSEGQINSSTVRDLLSEAPVNYAVGERSGIRSGDFVFHPVGEQDIFGSMRGTAGGAWQEPGLSHMETGDVQSRAQTALQSAPYEASTGSNPVVQSIEQLFAQMEQLYPQDAGELAQIEQVILAGYSGIGGDNPPPPTTSPSSGGPGGDNPTPPPSPGAGGTGGDNPTPPPTSPSSGGTGSDNPTPPPPTTGAGGTGGDNPTPPPTSGTGGTGGGPPGSGTDMSSVLVAGPGTTSTDVQHATSVLDSLPAAVQQALLQNGAQIEIESGFQPGDPEGENNGYQGLVYTDSGMENQALIHEASEMAGQLTSGVPGLWDDPKAIQMADQAMTSPGFKDPGDLNDTIGSVYGDGDLISNIIAGLVQKDNPSATAGDTIGQSIEQTSIQDAPQLTAYIAQSLGINDPYSTVA
jgi:hypothetical protein